MTTHWHLIVSPAQRSKFIASLDGEVLGVFRTPMLSSARVLLERGASPDDLLTMSHAGSPIVAMRSTVGVAAKLTVKEPDKGGGPRFAAHEPYDASVALRVASPAAVPGAPGVGVAENQTAVLDAAAHVPGAYGVEP